MRKISNLFGVLLFVASFAIFAGCSKDDDDSDPVDAVTLNMLDEQNGTTKLGASDVYINKSYNFYTKNNYITDAGAASGVGAKLAPKLDNLVHEAAVVKGHVYQIFAPNTLLEFLSGVKAIRINSPYYQMYVASAIKQNDVNTGAVVKYFSASAQSKTLPEWEHNIATFTTQSEQIEWKLPKDAECFFDHKRETESFFDFNASGGKLTIRLNAAPNNISGPWGTYHTYIRVGSVYSSVTIQVAYQQ